MLNEHKHNTILASKRSAMYSTCFPVPTRVLDANGIAIASAVFAGLNRWQTDTERTAYGVFLSEPIIFLLPLTFGTDVNKDGKLQWHDFELARDVSFALIFIDFDISKIASSMLRLRTAP